MRTYKNVELLKETADKFGAFLKRTGIHYEASGAYSLVHFEVLVNDRETELCNDWLEKN